MSPDSIRRPASRAASRSIAPRTVVYLLAGTLSLTVLLVAGIGGVWYGKVKGSLNTSQALSGGIGRSTDGSVNILLIGLDSRRAMDGTDLPRDLLDLMHVGSSSDVGGYNTNVLILVHIPRTGPAIGFSIPRDDYVEIPGRPGMYKIKEAYGRAKADAADALVRQGVSGAALEKQSREAGRKATLQTVWNLLGVPIDHFAEVNLVGFYDLATALDGIPVCLNHPASDPDYSGADLPAGYQTLDGVQALEFVRQRHNLAGGDLDRTRRQQAFLAGTVHKLSGQGVFADLGKLDSLLAVAKKDVVVDDGLDPIAFLDQAHSLTDGDTDFSTLPIEGFATRAGQSVNLVDPAKLRRIVQTAFGQVDPAGTGPSQTPSETPTMQPAAYPVPAAGDQPSPSSPAEVDGIPCVD